MAPSKLELAISALDVLVPIAKAVPFLLDCGGLAGGRQEDLGGMKNNTEAASDLAEDAARWVQNITNAIDGYRGDLVKLRTLELDMQSLLEVLRTIASFLAKRVTKVSFMGIMKGALRKSEDADKLKKLKDELKSAYDRFMVKSSIRVEVAIQNMTSKADIDRMQAVLSPTYSARFDARESPDGCLADTRTNILHILDDWVADHKNTLSVFWLSGMAGTGKSTIAKTFCKSLSDRKRLAASYFISRQSTSRSDAFSLVSTLAYELTKLHHSVLEHVCRVIQDQPGIADRPMEEQILALVVNPLRQHLTTNAPRDLLVIVVDALDECSKSAECVQFVRTITSLLANLAIKLFLTSRNEKYLRDAFSSVSHESLKLHDLEQGLVSVDVRRFFKANLTHVALERKIDDWPTVTDIDSLTERTGYLFIYAATAIKFIEQSRFDPEAQLQIVLAIDFGSSNIAPDFGRLDILYRHILASAIANDEGKPDARLAVRVQHLLSTVLLAEESLTLATLAGLVGCDMQLTRLDCESLGAVLRVPDEASESITPLHLSFPDFLRTSERCADARFLVVDSAEHVKVAARCLALMNDRLKTDICSVRDPNILARDLAEVVGKCITGELRYACLYWSQHLSQSPFDLTNVAQIQLFCASKILN